MFQCSSVNGKSTLQDSRFNMSVKRNPVHDLISPLSITTDNRFCVKSKAETVWVGGGAYASKMLIHMTQPLMGFGKILMPVHPSSCS